MHIGATLVEMILTNGKHFTETVHVSLETKLQIQRVWYIQPYGNLQINIQNYKCTYFGLMVVVYIVLTFCTYECLPIIKFGTFGVTASAVYSMYG